MISISVRSYRTLPDPPSMFKVGSRFAVELADGTTVHDLIKRVLAFPEEEIELVAVNGKHEQGDYVLQMNDRVDIFPVITGG